ncbi:1-aminocyclopropane-1-carboxylate deaminase/D-cysteine desulfhydrase [Altibacter sp. HG106]|uniref:1-aminocyclopropane-1-carboxylate deaminase/D-cysteine desulfhydrase n=1 Tax=Altibacter sp. HG106 TaxID=3023937 RepID=UPI00234FE978|nr:pyridoxal-phosphate dependent enzyme [Altibacter sp. HG106]MDC7995899.1 pyridoxal-phosphate dependent enzyme [Altibacter sp. HG106]
MSPFSFEPTYDVVVDEIKAEFLTEKGVSLHLLREDTLHPEISGNKFRKLKYNVAEALNKKSSGLLTFGGAYSNHIAAAAAVGKRMNLPTIGIIRGDELENSFLENPTLRFAHEQGMQLEFWSRNAFRRKDSTESIEGWKQQWGDVYILPEGGTNALAVKGCAEIIKKPHHQYTHIAVSVGTGGTLAGIATTAKPHQQLLGFSVLKGTFQAEVIEKYAPSKNVILTDDYCFGGYAKVTPSLISFINTFRLQNNIQLDPVYTGKMMWGLFDWVKNGKFPKNSRILAVHTGGLQGIAGMNQQLKRKNKPQILTS